MDYSLLLGVHYRAPQQLRPPASYNHSTSLDGLARLAEEGGYKIQSRKCYNLVYHYFSSFSNYLYSCIFF